MNRFQLLFYYIYSFLFCLRHLPFRQALHIPILIHPSVKVKSMPRGCVEFQKPIRHGMLILGFEGTLGHCNCRSLICIKNGGRLVVGNSVNMACGTRLVINGGTMTIGSHFYCNSNCYFNCTTKITIGNNNMYGWDNTFNTSDGHHVFHNGIEKPMEGDITIGNHVWITTYCHIAKNTFIADDCIVAQNSLVGKRFETTKSLIGGMPAKVIKGNITWKG